MMRAAFLAITLWLGCPPAALGHEVRPAYLELRESAPDQYAVLWKVPALGDDLRLGLYVQLPETCSTDQAPVGSVAGGAHVERWRMHCPGGLRGGAIRIDGLAATLTDVLVRLEFQDGSAHVARLTPDAPGLVVPLAPGALDVVRTYGLLGAEHILLGFDHLLFVVALLLLVRGSWRIVGTVTAFTVAHSLTLGGATLGFLHAPAAPVEAVIALSIVFVAAEIVHERQGRSGMTARHPWTVAFLFGLVHGFGFAGALAETGLPQTAIPLALLCFNVGVEIGQLVFIGVASLAIWAWRRLYVSASAAPVWAWRILPYSIGSMAAFWGIQRIAAFG